MRKIDIFDTTLRDGEQSAGINLNTAEKVEIAKQLERLGVTIIEAGFPASSPGDLEAVSLIAKTVKNSIVTGLARAVKSDIDAVWEAIKHAEQPHVHTFIATSPIHMEYKLKKNPDQVVEQESDMTELANNSDYSVQTIQQQANRINQNLNEEVYISLR